jgi:hypothetical protein
MLMVKPGSVAALTSVALVAGARRRLRKKERCHLTGREDGQEHCLRRPWLPCGDAGGGGSDLDYQAIGLFGYRVSKSVILQLGYRYLYVNYRNNPPPAFLFDAHLSGALLGVTFNLK